MQPPPAVLADMRSGRARIHRMQRAPSLATDDEFLALLSELAPRGHLSQAVQKQVKHGNEFAHSHQTARVSHAEHAAQ